MLPLSMRCRLENMSSKDLVDQFAGMVQWCHYDPHGRKRPSEFEMDDLRNELIRRLEAGETLMEAIEDLD